MTYHILLENYQGGILRENAGISYILLEGAPINSLNAIRVNSLKHGSIAIESVKQGTISVNSAQHGQIQINVRNFS